MRRRYPYNSRQEEVFMRTITLGVLILTLWGSASAIAQLPPEIQADSYLLRAEKAIGEGDQARARAEIDKIILFEKEHELDLAAEFHFRYAKAAATVGCRSRHTKPS